MSYAGSDLSRKRLDASSTWRLTSVEVMAASPDVDALRTLAARVFRHGRDVTGVIESMTRARFVHDQLELRGRDVAEGPHPRHAHHVRSPGPGGGPLRGRGS